MESPIACYSFSLPCARQPTPPGYYGGVALQGPPNTDASLETPSMPRPPALQREGKEREKKKRRLEGKDEERERTAVFLAASS